MSATQIWAMTASEIASGIRNGLFSASEAIDAQLARMDAANPQINAVVQDCADEAREAARRLDAQLARGEDPGPLCGVPVTIKVNVDQHGFATTNGIRAQASLVASQDSPVVSNIRKAGGVIVGRTNTPAFSLRWFTRNALHGQTLNPHDAAITPGGSSGGAAAAVAAGLCAIGHGTDIAGSIRYPAYACGVHGLRPSFGRVPAYNASGPDRHIGAQLMAVSGPIARCMADLDLSLAAMSAGDSRDPWWVPAPLTGGDFRRRAALSIAPDGMSVSPEVEAALLQAADMLRASGWTVDEAAAPPMRRAAEVNARLWMAETQFGAGDMIAREADADASFVFDQMSRDAGEVGFDTLMKTLQARVGLVREWEAYFETYSLLLCPTSAEPPFPQQLDVASEQDFARVFEAQLTQRAIPAIGVPALSVALGHSTKGPIGVQLVAARFREDILLAAGRDLEALAGLPPLAVMG